MHNAINTWLWPFHATDWRKRMTHDADRLLAEFGTAAHDVAVDRSWREDVGLLKSRDPGHWSRVTLELGRRLAAREETARKAESQAALH